MAGTIVKFANTIHIWSNCDKRYDNCASLANQWNYNIPKIDGKNQQVVLEKYFTGSRLFRVSEIEVFVVSFLDFNPTSFQAPIQPPNP